MTARRRVLLEDSAIEGYRKYVSNSTGGTKRHRTSILSHPDLVEFETGLLEFGIEQPHRVENFPVIGRCSGPVGLPIGEDAVVPQIAHHRRIGDPIVQQIA